MAYKINLLFHLKSIKDSMARFGADSVAMLDARTFQLELKARNRYYQLNPQFLYRSAGRMHYTPRLPENHTGFVGFLGWLPYFNKRWPIALDKLAFKEFCAGAGLRTPRFWRGSSDGARNFIVKRRHSSFGLDIRGPFKAIGGAGTELSADGSEFYEEFVPGQIAKIWYWEGNPACLELLEMPKVTGNGRDSVYGLVQMKAQSPRVPPERAEIEAVVRYQGMDLDEVIPQGTSAIADFRYGSSLHPVVLTNLNALTQCLNTEAGRQLSEAGPAFWRQIPEQIRASTLFTVDAIVDGENLVWFLEMNCNPQVHPDAYLPMLEGLFGPADAPTAVTGPQPWLNGVPLHLAAPPGAAMSPAHAAAPGRSVPFAQAAPPVPPFVGPA